MCGGDTEEARAGIMATSTGAPWGITLKHTHTHTHTHTSHDCMRT